MDLDLNMVKFVEDGRRGDRLNSVNNRNSHFAEISRTFCEGRFCVGQISAMTLYNKFH